MPNKGPLPLSGYIIVSRAWPATRWSKSERRLCSAQSFQVFKTQGAAARAVDDTIRFALGRQYNVHGWRRQDFDIRRVGPGRTEP